MRVVVTAFAVSWLGCASAAIGPELPQPTSDIPAPVAHVAQPALRDGTGVPLPAGLYFRDGYLASQVDAEQPVVAVVSGVFDTPAQAEAHLREPAVTAFAPGYPLVVHSHELAPDDETIQGIVVVAALFANRSDAAAYPGGRAVPLLSKDEAFRRSMRRGPKGEDIVGPAQRVLRMRVAAPAYPADAIDRGEEAHWNWKSHRGPDPMVSPPPVLCTIPADALFVIENDDSYAHFRRWAPVDCNGRPAYVRRQDTLLETVFVQESADQTRLIQVEIVECDMAWYRVWTIEAGGGAKLADAAGAGGAGCGS